MNRIDETIPGGKYLGSDGRFHDAHGNIIEDATCSIASSNELPVDFPARQTLLDAGATTIQAVAALSDEVILALSGIGNATLTKIRAYEVSA